MRETIGQRIRTERKAKGLTQPERSIMLSQAQTCSYLSASRSVKGLTSASRDAIVVS